MSKAPSSTGQAGIESAAATSAGSQGLAISTTVAPSTVAAMMASPPTRGIGRTCTLRWPSGRSIQPRYSARRWTSGIRTSAAPKLSTRPPARVSTSIESASVARGRPRARDARSEGKRREQTWTGSTALNNNRGFVIQASTRPGGTKVRLVFRFRLLWVPGMRTVSPGFHSSRYDPTPGAAARDSTKFRESKPMSRAS